MHKIQLPLLFYIFLSFPLYSQVGNEENLDEIIITSSRIEIPFSKNSKSVQIISSNDIKESTATNLSELLQQVAGIDIVRRGTRGMQSDVSIRGGNFEQTLILIDGFKTENPQSGHHTANMLLPLENIERIEIIKGSSARIFGQNAFTGAINIVTKKEQENQVKLSSSYGSNKYTLGEISVVKNLKNSNHFVYFSQSASDGYRENSDFKNTNYFLKSSINTKNNPITLVASFADRKFGAQYFYTSPASNFTEYEETQSSLVGISTRILKHNFTLKPKIYWKRGQDLFQLKRDDPSFSRNFNISNKIGVALNTSYKSSIGITGLGVDFAKVSLSSNNLGDQNRTIFSTFIEHRFNVNNKIDITPGVSASLFSDFGFQAFPGLDLGIKMTDKTRLFWNVGSSYRVPTYTELYINIPNFLSGNTNLKPEKAISQEIGVKFKNNKFSVHSSLFYRVSRDLIDYVKETSTSPFYEAQNLRKIVTQGLEVNSDYSFELFNKPQKASFSYTFLDDDYADVSVFKSRYLINSSIKHHFTTSLKTSFVKNLHQTISYRFVDKPLNTYHIVDAKIMLNLKNMSFYTVFNNIFDVDYQEKIFIPMPKRNMEFGLSYKFH
ncbi:MAG: TonB-dependent receptor [Flavobacteriaceae bacterium]